MNYTLIIAGLFFLFNPEINILDLLPDFIGIILIMRGMRPITLTSLTAENSYKSFSKYLAVSAIKTFAILPVISVASSDPTFYMLFTLVFAILELIFAIPAFADLYETISDSARYAGIALSRSFGVSKAFTQIFLIIKSFLALAPELVYLYVIQEDVAVYPIAPYKPALMLICLTVGQIFGIIWLICTSRIFFALRRCKTLTLDIIRRISEVSVSLADTVRKTVPRLTSMITLAAVFTVPFCIDGFPILPLAFASALAVYISKLAEKIYGHIFYKLRNLTIVSTVVSVISFIATAVFSTLYQKQAALSIKRIYKQFSIPAVLWLASCLVFAAVLINIGKLLKKLVREHTGSMVPLPSETRDRENLAQRADLSMKLGAVLVIGSTAASYILLYTVPIYQIIASAVSLAWVAYISRIMSEIVTGIGDRYPK